MRLFGDNQASVQMTQEARLPEASKHQAIYYHFVCKKVDHGKITVTYVRSEVNISDISTTRKDEQPHINLAGLMGIGDSADVKGF